MKDWREKLAAAGLMLLSGSTFSLHISRAYRPISDALILHFIYFETQQTILINECLLFSYRAYKAKLIKTQGVRYLSE